MNMSDNAGSINLIIGCMFSGKSTETIRLIRRYQNIKGKNILVINHEIDKRYGESVISSHDKVQIKCISLKNLFDFVTNAADNDRKNVFVTGLDGDYKRDTFGDICRLIPHAENVTKLKALCVKCEDGTLATFTKRIINNDKVELVGNDDIYIPVCRFHYLEN